MYIYYELKTAAFVLVIVFLGCVRRAYGRQWRHRATARRVHLTVILYVPDPHECTRQCHRDGY